jgi:hypothetical protein
MIKLFISILLFISISLNAQNVYLLTKAGIPSYKGIEIYLKQNINTIVDEYQKFVNDTLYDIYITSDDLSKYTDNNNLDALGFCFCEKGSSEIIITNEEKYLSYEVSMLSKYKRRNIIESDAFVKGVIIHELTHLYFNQIIMKMRIDSMFVSPEYNNFSMVSRNSFGSEFIEEGICTYVSVKMGECIIGKNYIPESIDEITDKHNRFDIMYKYSSQYVKLFLNKNGITKGIELIIGIKPPTLEEILNTEKYWNKFKKK